MIAPTSGQSSPAKVLNSDPLEDNANRKACALGAGIGGQDTGSAKQAVKADLLQRLTKAAQLCAERRSVANDRGFMSLNSRAAPVVADPWDVLRGKTLDGENEFDVLGKRAGPKLKRLVSRALVQHWGPECSTFSRARGKPIPNVSKDRWPPQVRNAEFVEGIPSVMRALPGSARRVADANEMVNLAAQSCIEAVLSGRYFTLENPDRSWMWQMPLIRQLPEMPGVQLVFYHSCAFGGHRRKYQAICTNIPGFDQSVHRLCGAADPSMPCEHSGEAHLPWEPSGMGEASEMIPTQFESEYSPELSAAVAKPVALLINQELEKARHHPVSFIEVFSGPNAPLTSAVRSALGLPGDVPNPLDESRGESIPTPEAASSSGSSGPDIHTSSGRAAAVPLRPSPFRPSLT